MQPEKETDVKGPINHLAVLPLVICRERKGGEKTNQTGLKGGGVHGQEKTSVLVRVCVGVPHHPH